MLDKARHNTIVARHKYKKRKYKLFQAIKRLQARNNLTEEEARHRLEAQPTNLQQVAPANVVFSPYWSYEYTQQQIDKAWDNLQLYLNKRKADAAKL